MNLRTVALSVSALGAVLVATPAAAQGCTRESLQQLADGYVKAQEEANVLGNLPVGEWFVLRENFERSSVSQGIMSVERPIEWHLALLDTMQCQVYVEAVMLQPEPYVTGAKFGTGYFGVSEVNIITSTTGDWLFDADKTLAYASREDWGVLPEDQRSTREEIMAAANAYLDKFNDPSVEVPWGTPCRRLEGGIYTGKGEASDSCDVGVPEGVALVDRSYIVDEERGAVAVFLRFGGEEGLADVHTFRVVNGKITNVHTITNCGGEENCGFPPLSEMLANNPDMQPDPALFD